MASPGQKRPVRPPKPIDGSGNVVMAELQKRLKGRKESNMELGYTPMKPIGRSKSDKVSFSIQEQSGGLSGRTRWHIQPPSYDEPEHPFTASVPTSQSANTRKSPSPEKSSHHHHSIPPPPKTPPPILTNRVNRSPVPSGEPPKLPISKSVSSAPVPIAAKGNRHGSEEEEFGSQSNSLKAPLAGSRSIGGSGVKDLAKFFSRREESVTSKFDQLNKASSEPKDLGTGDPDHVGAGWKSSVPTVQSLGRGRRVPGGSSSSESEFTSSTESNRSYQNIFEDEAFARFDKRPKQSRSLEGAKREKKPKPLPRKSSVSSLTLRTATMNDSAALTNETNGRHPDVTMIEEASKNPASTTSKFEADAQVSVGTESNPFTELETEIELLVDITNLPSRLSQLPSTAPDASGQTTLGVRQKVELNKALSHNPSGTKPITRRNSPQVRKELRKGVCSDGDQDDSEMEDDYISMGSIPHLELTSTLRKDPPSPAVQVDPRSSAYYLKILPNDPLPPSPKEPPKSPGDTYIKIGEVDAPLRATEMEKQSAQSERKLSTGKVSGLAISKTSGILAVKYSEVTIQNCSRGVHTTSEDGAPSQVFDTAAKGTSGTVKLGRTTEATLPLKYQEVLLKDSKTDSKDVPNMKNTQNDLQAQKVSRMPEQGKVSGEPRKFADRPLPPRPPENPYYNTAPGLHLTVPKPRAVWDGYVEVDEDEINKMTAAINRESLTAAPMPQWLTPSHNKMVRVEIRPKVPDRPDTLDSSEEDENKSSGEYSYAAVPGQSLFGFQWMKFHANSMAERSTPPPSISVSSHDPSNSGSNHVTQKEDANCRYVDASIHDSRPPTPPPKTESLLREVSLFPAYVDGKSSPSRRKMSAPEIFNLSTGTPRGSQPACLPRRKTSEESLVKSLGKRRVPPSRPKRPPKNLHKKLQLAKPLPGQTSGPHSDGVGTSREARQRNVDRGTKAHLKASRQRSHSSGEIPIKRSPLRQSKSYAPIHPSGSSADPQDKAPDIPPTTRLQKRSSVRSKVDRRSLAIIMKNKEAISQQLSIGSEAGGPSTSGNPTIVRTLGDILLELDALLHQKLYTEQDLISAIEQHLSIHLQPADVRTSSDEGSPTRQAVSLDCDPTRGPKSAVVPQITEQDVEDVVSYMSANQGSSLKSRNDSSQPLRKPRSDTVIVFDDCSSSDSREHSEEAVTCSIGVTKSPSKSNSSFLEISSSMRDGRSHSTGNRKLRRVNAKRRPSATAEECLTSTNALYNNGTGVFTHKGGKLMNVSSGVEIEIPEGAIPKGKSQRIWFEILQPVCNLSRGGEVPEALVEPTACGLESHLREKQDRWIQLSPVVLVGPCDTVLQKPIKIKIPHCLPYRNNSWHLHVLARAQNGKSDDWFELPNSSGLIIPSRKHKHKLFLSTTYQMHLHYAIVRTKQLGSFKLTGTPVGKGAHSAKRMVASVYAKTEDKGSESGYSLEVFMTNSIFDQVQVGQQYCCSTVY